MGAGWASCLTAIIPRRLRARAGIPRQQAQPPEPPWHSPCGTVRICQAAASKNASMRRGSHCRLPGKGPDTKPTCPPCRGYSSSTQGDTSARSGQVAPGQERIVARVHDQGGQADALQIGRTAGAGPVVVGVAEAMQRCRHQVVELVQIARARQRACIVQTGEALQLRETLGFERAQEVPGVDPVHSPPEQMAGGVQVHRGGHGGSAGDDTLRRLANASEPLEQGVAAQRDAGGKAQSWRVCRHPPQDPVDLRIVAGMIGARQEIRRTAAAAEVRHCAAPAASPQRLQQGARVMAAGAALQSVEQHHQRLRRCSPSSQSTSMKSPSGVSQRSRCSRGGGRAPEQEGVDGLQMSAGQPARRPVSGLARCRPILPRAAQWMVPTGDSGTAASGGSGEA